jgi:hypothetical protein
MDLRFGLEHIDPVSGPWIPGHTPDPGTWEVLMRKFLNHPEAHLWEASPEKSPLWRWPSPELPQAMLEVLRKTVCIRRTHLTSIILPLPVTNEKVFDYSLFFDINNYHLSQA